MRFPLRLALLLLAGMTSLAACTGQTDPTATTLPAALCAPDGLIIDYASMPYEQIIENSDAVFYGRVSAVSETSTNQDSGQCWDGGLPVYTIEVEVLQD